jgi:hypothetical protein
VTPFSWLICAALVIAEYLAYRWLLRVSGEVIGLGRPTTLGEVVGWHLGRLEERLAEVSEIGGGGRG